MGRDPLATSVSTQTGASQELPAFGRRLKRLRRATGFKQAALAHVMHVDQATISRWENGVQVPSSRLQSKIFAALANSRTDDSALKRLVQFSGDCLHLVDEASHVCLAYSPRRARDWSTSQQSLLGVSLWQFATDEIRQAEAELTDEGWWDLQTPAPKAFMTSQVFHDRIRINAGQIVWERLYLSDGTPVRLVSGNRGRAA